MATARQVWPDIPADWTPKAPQDTDWFVFDCTAKEAERNAGAITGTPTFAAFLPGDPNTSVNDLTFSNTMVTANDDGLANQVVSVMIAGGVAGNVYRVTMTFVDTAARTLTRSQLLSVETR